MQTLNFILLICLLAFVFFLAYRFSRQSKSIQSILNSHKTAYSSKRVKNEKLQEDKSEWPKSDTDGLVKRIGIKKSSFHLIKNGKEYKKCTQCGEWLPLHYFYYSEDRWDHLRSNCVECMRKSRSMRDYPQDVEDIVLKDTRLWPQYDNDGTVVSIEGSAIFHLMKHTVEFKKCAHCGKWLPLSHFAVNNRHYDKKQSWCRDCSRSYERSRLSRSRDANGSSQTLFG